MAHYIDKDAVLAEVKKIKKDIGSDAFLSEYERGVNLGKELACDDIIYSLNTLEVKEVDFEHLEQEVKDFCYKFDDRKDKWYDMTPHDKNIMVNPTWSNFAMQLAKHFFELGLHCSQADNSYIEGVKGSYTTTDKD